MEDVGGGGGFRLPPMTANVKKVGHAAGVLALIRKFDLFSTFNLIILLVVVGRSQLSLLQYTLFL